MRHTPGAGGAAPRGVGAWCGFRFERLATVTLLDRDTAFVVHDAARTGILVDGRDYYRAFHAAALTAQRSILLLGWQFDSDVALLRGEDVPPGAAAEDVELLRLLDRLCRERPGLEIRVLAWDHSVVFALEREVLQKLYFDAITCRGFHFRWDDTVPLGGSHHQKVAIVDGTIAFLGSQDLCQSRWDDSCHRLENPLRTSRGVPHRPYHEVQVALTGAAARSMVDLFVTRWEGATGERLDAAGLVAPGAAAPAVPVTLAMPPARLGLARTVPAIDGSTPVQEVSVLHARAIAAAERLVYVESQYLTSCAVRDALVRRMEDRTRPPLDVIVVLPHKPEGLKEEMTVGVPQAMVLATLAEAARANGHRFGVYDVLAGHGPDGAPVYVYIHAKLMIVDDRVLVVGSANLTNRSMAIDSEICAVYEAEEGSAVAAAIAGLRRRLLTEHAGVALDDAAFAAGVGALDRLARAGEGRLRPHPIEEVQPSALAKAVHELTLEFLDPFVEHCPPAA